MFASLEPKFNWGKIKQEILEQPEVLLIKEHMSEMLNQLKEIHSKYIADEFVSLREAATLLKSFIQRLPSPVNELHLFKITRHSAEDIPENFGIRMQIVPLDLINDVFDERFAILFRDE